MSNTLHAIIALEGAATTPEEVSQFLKAGGGMVCARAFLHDRKWFAKHLWRRYRMRLAMDGEFPDAAAATHCIIVRSSRVTNMRLAWRLRPDETMPNTDREIAAMLGIETLV
jgi:hypothetical protein